MKNKLFVIIVCISLSGICKGQGDVTGLTDNPNLKQWTLEECIAYAVANNLSMNQSKIDLLVAENDLKQSRFNRLPTLVSNISQRHSMGHTIDPITSDFVNQPIRSTAVGATASLTLWKGGLLSRETEKKGIIVEQHRFLVEQAKNDIILATIESYMMALSLNESIKIAKKEVENSSYRYQVGKGKFDVGSISSIDLAIIESQRSSDLLLLVNAENEYSARILNLKQLLEIPPHQSFDIVKNHHIEENKPIPAAKDLYESAWQYMPETKLSRLELEIRQADLRIAKTGYFPTLSLNGGLATGYTNTQQERFAGQFRNNFSPSVSLDLTIPIFSQFTNRTNLRNSELAIKRSALNIRKQDRELYNKMETIVQNTRSAQAQMNAAHDALRSTELSYALANKKNTLGALSLAELIVAKNEYLNNSDKYIQAKLTFTLYQKMIEFYQDGSL